MEKATLIIWAGFIIIPVIIGVFLGMWIQKEFDDGWTDFNLGPEFPPMNERVLIFTNQNTIVVSRIVDDKVFGKSWLDDDFQHHDLYTVLYWKKLPKDPREQFQYD